MKSSDESYPGVLNDDISGRFDDPCLHCDPCKDCDLDGTNDCWMEFCDPCVTWKNKDEGELKCEIKYKKLPNVVYDKFGKPISCNVGGKICFCKQCEFIELCKAWDVE